MFLHSVTISNNYTVHTEHLQICNTYLLFMIILQQLYICETTTNIEGLPLLNFFFLCIIVILFNQTNNNNYVVIYFMNK